MMFRPLPIMSVFVLISLAILIWLGNWQYGRFTEKKFGPEEVDTIPVSAVELVLDNTLEGNLQQVYGQIDGEVVWRRYAPAKLLTSGEQVLVLIDATGGTQPVPKALMDLPEKWTAEARILEKPAKRGMITNPDQPSDDIWYTLDAPAMLANMGIEAGADRIVEPLRLTVSLSNDLSRVREAENPYAMQKLKDPLPPERHFGYALTWWGMAIGLLGVYFAFHHAQGRLRFRKQS